MSVLGAFPAITIATTEVITDTQLGIPVMDTITMTIDTDISTTRINGMTIITMIPILTGDGIGVTAGASEFIIVITMTPTTAQMDLLTLSQD